MEHRLSATKNILPVSVLYIEVEGATKEYLLTIVDHESKKGVDLSEEVLQAIRGLVSMKTYWHFNTMILPAT